MASRPPPEKKKKRSWRAKDDRTRDSDVGESITEVAVLPKNIIEIDGSILEGGGQILRNAVTLSCLLGKPVHISKIRAGRSKPGLRPQHLTGIQLIRNICKGNLTGDGVGSDDIVFTPGPLLPGQYVADTKTAGSICLLIQAVLPCLLFTPGSTQIVLRGGTNADMAPPIDYLLKVFKPMISKFGIDFECNLDKRGFYPKGGGQVTLTLRPISQAIRPIELTSKGDIETITVESFTAGTVPRRAGHAMCSGAERVLKQHFSSCTINTNVTHLSEHQAMGNGSGIIVTTCTSMGCVFGGSGIGNRNEDAEETGSQAAQQFIDGTQGNSCVDEHLQDQLIIFMALAEGMSQIRTGPLTMHTKTAIHIAEKITGVHFEVDEINNSENVVKCRGLGYNNK